MVDKIGNVQKYTMKFLNDDDVLVYGELSNRFKFVEDSTYEQVQTASTALASLSSLTYSDTSLITDISLNEALEEIQPPTPPTFYNASNTALAENLAGDATVTYNRRLRLYDSVKRGYGYSFTTNSHKIVGYSFDTKSIYTNSLKANGETIKLLPTVERANDNLIYPQLYAFWNDGDILTGSLSLRVKIMVQLKNSTDIISVSFSPYFSIE